jgi:hypothetical protein
MIDRSSPRNLDFELSLHTWVGCRKSGKRFSHDATGDEAIIGSTTAQIRRQEVPLPLRSLLAFRA